ncbi:MAG: serine hydrolase domain-containing protein [Bacteroidota bacterium]
MKHILFMMFIVLLVVSGVSPVRAKSTSQPDFATIDSFIEKEMAATHLPGLALAIVHDDQVVYLKGYGTSDQAGTPVTPRTPFMLASLSKSFTALAAMQLVEAGKIDLDAPVQTYLPWFRVADEKASAEITVRNLLNHTSGLPGSAAMQFFAGDSDMETQVRALANVELDRPVGESYEYANPSYAVLAMIVQQVSGQPFQQYVQEYIFSPLQMTNTFTSKEEALQQGLATGYTYALNIPIALDVPYNRGGIAYCCIISSAEDLSHYLIAQMNGGRYAGKSILSAQGIDAMHAPAVREDRPERYYGMAWETRPINGIPVVMHTGEGPGWQTNLIMLPNGWAVAVLANGYNFVDASFGADRLRGIARGVVSLIAGRTPPPAASGAGAYVFHGALAVIVLVQLAGMSYSIRYIRRWQKGERLPRGTIRRLAVIALPLVVNLLWAGLVFFEVPNLLMPYDLMKLLVPALAYTLILSGLVALGWSMVRTAMMVQAFRNERGVPLPVRRAEVL